MGKNNAIIITIIISVVVIIIALLVLFTFKPANSSSQNTVTVEGTSTIKVMPDLIAVDFDIQTKGNTSAEATKANNKIYDDLVEQITIAGFNQSDLKTESFNVNPNTYWDTEGKSRTDGYTADHYVSVELPSDQIDNVSAIIDAGVNSGAGISSINFELTQQSQNDDKAQALKLASQDAEIKANAIASGFGKQAGKLISVQTSDFVYEPWNVYSSSGVSPTTDVALAKAAAANIQPSQQEVTATITATFRLK